MNVDSLNTVGLGGAHLVQIAADVESVEKCLHQMVKSRIKVVSDVCTHTLVAGGKRLRPAFLILSARATGREFTHTRGIELGACLELIHMATLIHDDVIDESDTRRGKPTANTQFGNTASILSGDVLLARAMQILALDGDLRMIRAAAEMVIELAEGEARELEVRNDWDLPESEHYAILRMKTASFVECCCRLGGLLAGAEEAHVEALARFGHHLGMAFQIVDDLLDYRSNPETLGKPKMTDFQEGCMTLPLLYFREQSDDLKPWFGKSVGTDQMVIIETRLTEAGVFARAEAQAQSHLDQGLAALNELPDSSHRELLAAAGQFVLRRNY